MKKQFKWMLLVLILALALGAAAPMALAAGSPAATSNVDDHEYSYDRWANPVKSYLVDNGDGTLTRVEYTGEAVAVETYDSSLSFVDGFTIEMELPIFGGFHSGEDSNFLVFGQKNPDETDETEVIRVVKYTKDWERVGAASLYGANTYIPFDAGSLRFAEYNGYLYIRTAHEMYTNPSDGLNHQSNMTMNVRIADMVITDSVYEVLASRGYVSHSFNQFIAVDGTDLIAVDHGDAYPRSVVMTKYNAPAGQDSFLEAEKQYITENSYYWVYAKSLDVLPIMGSTGANDTGVALGGFELSSSSYLIAGNTVAQDDSYDAFGQRNIFVIATSKDNFSTEGTTVNYLTAYTADDAVTLSNPQFAKVGDDKYIILWTESGSETSGLRYAFVDGTGALTGEIYTAEGYLSDCQPIVFGNQVVWYVTSGLSPAFYTIDLDDPSTFTHGCHYTYEKKVDPTLTSEGSLSSTCTICGEAGEDVILPALNEEDYTISMRSLANCTHGGTDYYYLNETMYGRIRYGVPTPQLPHASYKVEAVAATCMAEGNIEYWTCSTCTGRYWSDETLSKRITNLTLAIDPDNHTALSEVTGATEATCTEPGYTGEAVCADCGVTVTGETIPALGHSLTHHEAVPATCVAEGTVEYWSCGVCSVNYADEAAAAEITDLVAPVDDENHAGETELVGKTDATCTESGYTGDTVCADCGETVAQGAVLEALGHTYEDGTCTVCGEAEPGVPGDANDDGKVNVADIMTAKTMILSGNTTSEEALRCDLNGDGKLNVLDLLLIKKLILV